MDALFLDAATSIHFALANTSVICLLISLFIFKVCFGLFNFLITSDIFPRENGCCTKIKRPTFVGLSIFGCSNKHSAVRLCRNLFITLNRQLKKCSYQQLSTKLTATFSRTQQRKRLSVRDTVVTATKKELSFDSSLFVWMQQQAFTLRQQIRR